MFMHQMFPTEYAKFISANSDMHTYMSMMVALLIGFRTNNCYTRYDTGVRISGVMRTTARTLIGQAVAYIHKPHGLEKDPESVRHIREIQRLTLLFCLFFKRHMHGQVLSDRLCHLTKIVVLE